MQDKFQKHGEFGQRIHEARTAAGLTQDALAHVIGVGTGTVNQWENGRHAPRGVVRRVVEEWLTAQTKQFPGDLQISP